MMMFPTDFIRRVGKGKTLSKNLTQKESEFAMNSLLKEEFTPAQMGSFLQAMRIKELSEEELYGFLQTCLRYQVIKLDTHIDFVINLSSDTPRKGGLLSLLAVGLLTQKGYKSAVVYSTPVLSQNTKSFQDSLLLLKNFFPKEFDLISQNLFSIEQLIPSWKNFNKIRGELGFRSFLHTLEKMLTPYQGSPMFIGISHKAYAKRMLESLSQCSIDANIVLGNHGVIDFLFHKPTVILCLKQNQVIEKTISLESLDLKLPTTLYSLSQFSLWNEFLQDSKSFLWDAIHFQAAGMLTLAHFYPTIQEAWETIKFEKIST